MRADRDHMFQAHRLEDAEPGTAADTDTKSFMLYSGQLLATLYGLHFPRLGNVLDLAPG